MSTHRQNNPVSYSRAPSEVSHNSRSNSTMFSGSESLDENFDSESRDGSRGRTDDMRFGGLNLESEDEMRVFPLSQRTLFDYRTFVDLLIKQFSLNPGQAGDLHQIVTWGSNLEHGDLCIRLSSAANMYKISNALESTALRDLEIRELLADVQQLLNKKWTINETQKQTILAIAKDTIFNPRYIDYGSLGTRVRDELDKVPEFRDVVTSPSRMRVVDKELSDKCRNVKNHFRKCIRDSCLGKNRISLDDAVRELAKKFLLGGILKVQNTHRVRIAMLRRFARENPHILNIEDEDEDEDDIDGNHEGDEEPRLDDSGVGSANSKRRKRADTGTRSETSNKDNQKKGKKSANGRVGKGLDWWSQVDAWLGKMVKDWGDNLDAYPWERYIKETMALEQPGNNSASSNVVSGPILGGMENNNNGIPILQPYQASNQSANTEATRERSSLWHVQRPQARAAGYSLLNSAGPSFSDENPAGLGVLQQMASMTARMSPPNNRQSSGMIFSGLSPERHGGYGEGSSNGFRSRYDPVNDTGI